MGNGPHLPRPRTVLRVAENGLKKYRSDVYVDSPAPRTDHICHNLGLDAESCEESAGADRRLVGSSEEFAGSGRLSVGLFEVSVGAGSLLVRSFEESAGAAEFPSDSAKNPRAPAVCRGSPAGFS